MICQDAQFSLEGVKVQNPRGPALSLAGKYYPDTVNVLLSVIKRAC